MVRLDWLVSVSHSVMPFSSAKLQNIFRSTKFSLMISRVFLKYQSQFVTFIINKVEPALGVMLGDALSDQLPVMLGVGALSIS